MQNDHGVVDNRNITHDEALHALALLEQTWTSVEFPDARAVVEAYIEQLENRPRGICDGDITAALKELDELRRWKRAFLVGRRTGKSVTYE
jgi:hypothetical protein